MKDRKTWTTGHDRSWGIRCGRCQPRYGVWSFSRDNLGLINDFAWLRKRFHEDYPDIDVQESAPQAENVPQESVAIVSNTNKQFEKDPILLTY